MNKALPLLAILVAQDFRPSVVVSRARSTPIEKWQAEGWCFAHLETVTTFRNNGCLAAFTGDPTSLVSFQVAILERDQRSA